MTLVYLFIGRHHTAVLLKAALRLEFLMLRGETVILLATPTLFILYISQYLLFGHQELLLGLSYALLLQFVLLEALVELVYQMVYFFYPLLAFRFVGWQRVDLLA